MKLQVRSSDSTATPPWDAACRGGPREGFTLIEVIGALVIFAVGVLMAASLAGNLSLQVQDAAVRAGVVSAAQEKIEEMERTEYASLTVGTEVEDITIQGRAYQRTTVIADYATQTRSVEVTVEPASGSSGPSHTLLSYAFEPW